MMMKVGVITQHRVLNWGSFLQAYATQIFFERQPGVKCEIIDYVYPNSFQNKHFPLPKPTLKSFIVKLSNYLRLSNIQRKIDRLEIAVNKSLNLSKKYGSFESLQNDPPRYDLYVTGSDQTLNPKFTFGDTNFLFSWVKDENAKIISFAASMPGNKFSPQYEKIYKELLSRYSVVSVREQNCVEYLSDLTGKDVFCHIDPTLLLSGDEWLSALTHLKRYRRIHKGYILIYKINHTFDSAPYIYEITKLLQKKTGLKVISLGSSVPKQYRIDCKSIKDAGPRDFIELFANSEYVITSSFHGTAFALNFGIPLYSIVPTEISNDSRQANLLKTCGLSNCLVPIGTEFNVINPNYDATKCQSILNCKRSEIANFITRYM